MIPEINASLYSDSSTNSSLTHVDYTSESYPDFQSSTPTSVPMGTDVKSLFMIPGASNVTEAILRPESIVAIPAYTLRFIPFVGSSPVLIAIALRQAFYRASRQAGVDSAYPKHGDQVTVEVASLLRSLGGVISRAKFFRLFKEGKLDWFVKRSNAEHTFEDGRIQRLPNTYNYQGLLLTPGDASDLYNWLISHNIQSDPVSVLTDAIKSNRDQILQFPYCLPDSPQQVFKQSLSVHEVVEKAIRLFPLDNVILGLCDTLAMHLIRPESFLSIPWYWFRKVLPDLGDDLGALYLMSKNCCFIDWEKGMDRSSFWVPGGLSTLQKWINSDSLPKQIPQSDPSLRGRPRADSVKESSEYVRSWREDKRLLIGKYLLRTDTRRSDTGLDWLIEVNDTQLTPDDELLRDSIFEYVYQAYSSHQPGKLANVLNNSNIINLLLRSVFLLKEFRLCNYETLVDMSICNSDTLSSEDICNFDTLVDDLICHFEILVSQNKCNFDTVINILVRLKDTFKLPIYTQPLNTDPTPPPFYHEQESNEVVVASTHIQSWNLTHILSRVNPVLSKQIREDMHPSIFISWLIYGCLNLNITSPISFAVARSLETRMDAGGPALRLAKSNPNELFKQLLTIKQRLESGYLGDNVLLNDVSVDLKSLLSPESSSKGKLKLIQRMIDSFGIY